MNREFILKQIGLLGKSWGGAHMADHLDGAKTFAVTLLIDVASGLYQDQAELMVDEAIAKARAAK